MGMRNILLRVSCPSCEGEVYSQYHSDEVEDGPERIFCVLCKRTFSKEEWKKIEQTAKSKKPKKTRTILLPPEKGTLAPQVIHRAVHKVAKDGGRKKPRKRAYKIIEYEHGKEIEFLDDCGFVSVAEVDTAIEKNFPGFPREKLYFLISDETGRLTIGTTK